MILCANPNAQFQSYQSETELSSGEIARVIDALSSFGSDPLTA